MYTRGFVMNARRRAQPHLQALHRICSLRTEVGAREMDSMPPFSLTGSIDSGWSLARGKTTKAGEIESWDIVYRSCVSIGLHALPCLRAQRRACAQHWRTGRSVQGSRHRRSVRPRWHARSEAIAPMHHGGGRGPRARTMPAPPHRHALPDASRCHSDHG